MPELVLSKDDKILLRVPLSEEGLTIGRSSECDLTLPDEDISRNHAAITFSHGIYTLTDLSSAGTLLNQKPVASALLKDGSVVGIGAWALTFRKACKQDEERKKELETCITRIKPAAQTKILKLNPEKNTLVTEHPLLFIFFPQGKTGKVALTKKITVVGSAPDCDVVIEDDYVSAKHCQIRADSNSWFLKDLDSTNGTLVHGHRIGETPLTQSLEFVVGKTRLKLASESKEEEVSPLLEDHFCGLVGQADSMRLLFAKIQKVAPSETTVLVHGETGSGKELVVRALHELSGRRGHPYIVLNCGAISANLIESEIFGHEKGAFTGAHMRRLGAFEEADNGTLFLDEVGELPYELQPKLLRVLENQTIHRVGSTAEIPVNVRVVAATHRNLAEQVKKGKFREDLYFRLYVIPLFVPPLRERPEDLSLLVEHFICQACPAGPPSLSSKALAKLAKHDWPGNVRELKNVVLRSLIFCEGSTIEAGDIELAHDLGKDKERDNLEMIEKEKIEEVLKETDGNKTKAAHLLGIAKSTLFKKLKEYGIEM